MKIEINQNHPALWGKLGVEETHTAAERLSGDSFKMWALLSLNQDGYVWCGDLEPHTLQELTDCGYLHSLDNGNLLFLPDGEAEGHDSPTEWSKLAGLYGSSSRQDLNYVRSKLQAVYLDDRMGDILLYWTEKYADLQKIDHSKARNRLKYDFSVVLVWWLWGNFRFEVGDVLEFGQDAKLLRYHDAMFKASIQDGAHKRRLTSLVMNEEKTVAYWNKNFAAEKFEIPLESVAKILRNRRFSE